MKTVNKRVIEIVEPQNESIERVLVFLRADAQLGSVRSKQLAQQYVQGIKTKNIRWWNKVPLWLFVLASTGVVATITGIILHFFA